MAAFAGVVGIVEAEADDLSRPHDNRQQLGVGNGAQRRLARGGPDCRADSGRRPRKELDEVLRAVGRRQREDALPVARRKTVLPVGRSKTQKTHAPPSTFFVNRQGGIRQQFYRLSC
jgi:hypothetical protein